MNTLTEEKHSSNPPRQNNSRARTYFKYLDGLRALAALWVVAEHVWVSQFNIFAHPGWRGLLTNWLAYGHQSVNIFIVLSGFCLGIPIAQAGEMRGGALQFYSRRARRILPPLYAAIAIAVVAQFLSHLLDPTIAKPTALAVLCNALLLQDVYPKINFLDTPLWSVALEWKIYFLLPLFELIIRKYGIGWAMGVGAAIGYGVTGIFAAVQPGMSLEHTCPWYVLLFAMGVSAAYICFSDAAPMKRVQLSVTSWRWAAGFFALALGFLLHKFSTYNPIDRHAYIAHLPLIDAVAGVLIACCLILITKAAQASDNTPVVKVLSSRPLVAIGLFAYSLYLTHSVVLNLLRVLLYKFGHGETASAFHNLAILGGFGVPVLIGFAYVFFVLFERPFTRKR
ncbi:hypothetical protein CCAX7_007770 [Capsulimonas corticalis]|uniref:Uncharacterized protein n=1 Tax=Capsulimonas corticalis TaxID=2219043 RepID=A0A402D1W8_9BACT|nr:acyltransferase [Capsulimonas corticalis]BDI28726.1 hypothetical protein CCAX7_007770 [Capsulimonas corticalis]